MKKSILFLLTAALLTPLFGAVAPVAETYDHTETIDITDCDIKASASAGVILYPNDSDAPRVLTGAEYNFRYTKLMIFDKDGVLIEAGGDLVPEDSVQLSVTVPPHGFMIAYGSAAPQSLRNCFKIAMEDAMLYNATMSIVYPMYGSYDRDTNKLTISYDDAVPPSADAPRFLFVGNSTTYVNGTPLKFRALCAAAGKEVVVEYCTFGSAYLSEFADANHERGKAFRNKLNAAKYDYVVLQDAASADFYTSKAAMDVLMPLIEANGAQALLYMRYSTGDAGTKRHYGNYPKLSKAFGGLPVANVTGSFNLCRELYPDIELLADDGGHHSREGSYLIAATWMHAFLGIDPRGNTYTASMPAETVAALQECAFKISEMGLELPEQDTSYDLDGVKYEMISKDKPYTVTGSVYTGNWTDADDSGKPLGKRTDGMFADAGDDTTIGCWTGATTDMTIDLGENCAVQIFKADLWGGTWGIPDPGEGVISVEVSLDGKTFEPVGEMERSAAAEAGGEWKKCDFLLILDEYVTARYVRATYKLAGNFCWTSEFGVYGFDGVGSDETSKPSEESTDASSEAVSQATSETVTNVCSAETPEEKPSSITAIVLCITAGVVAVLGGLAAFLRKKKKA